MHMPPGAMLLKRKKHIPAKVLNRTLCVLLMLSIATYLEIFLFSDVPERSPLSSHVCEK